MIGIQAPPFEKEYVDLIGCSLGSMEAHAHAHACDMRHVIDACDVGALHAHYDFFFFSFFFLSLYVLTELRQNSRTTFHRRVYTFIGVS